MFQMAGKYANLFMLLAVITLTHSWELPNLPSGRRSQYFVLHDDGGYKYGYDTGVDHFGKQAGDANNEVSGHYVYKAVDGQDVDVKYTAGVNGFIPEGLEKLVHHTAGPYAASHGYTYSAPTSSFQGVTDNQANTGDASYSFTIDTDSYKRDESSDVNGNVQGKYSFVNEAGQHDISYIAGANTGFVATSGSLSQPNGLLGKNVPVPSRYHPSSGTSGYEYSASVLPSSSAFNDGSYQFEYSTGDQSRQESSDAAGNVQGKYAFTNDAGTHDLSYVAGAKTGFQPTGGSLATPNGALGIASVHQPVAPSLYHATNYQATAPNEDGSYSFEFSTGDQSRQESSDAAGNIQGKYSFSNEAGTHDLSYVAGEKTGFQPTGGSLAAPNGLIGKTIPREYSSESFGRSGSGGSSADYEGYTYNPAVTTYSSEDNDDDQANTGDASYSFTIDTDDYKRQESSDAQGNVKGSFSYRNNAGAHDLSFVAGSETGFLPTGGSLSQPNGVNDKAVPDSSISSGSTRYHYKPSVTSYSNKDDDQNTGDASYSFTIDTDDYKRQESSDVQGNVKGTYSYKNNAGVHDLSFVAGSQTGFLPTGGSLATPNGLEGKVLPFSANADLRNNPPSNLAFQSDEESSGDASYKFSIDTDDYIRKESADSQGNVKGSYAYKNNAGSHDLSYSAGANTGFVPISGSLSIPNGFSGPYGAPDFIPPQVRMSDFAKTKAEFSQGKVGNVFLKQYYPSKSQSKYGYIFESS